VGVLSSLTERVSESREGAVKTDRREHSMPSRSRYLARAAIGLAVLVVASWLVRDGEAMAWEVSVFRFINELPDWLYRPLWLLMQFGNFAIVAVLAVVLMIFRKWMPAGAVLVVGVGKYLLEQAVKAIIVRHRPAQVIDDVILRGAPAVGRGFLSGHVVVAVGIATVLSPWLGRRTMTIVWALAGVVCFGRMYVGAHLPLDVVGGAALGWTLGSLINTVVRPDRVQRQNQ
jgi:glycosyltransferase 2 family protein